MSNTQNIFETLEKQTAALERLKRFDGGGGGGYDGAMEKRLTTLETKLETLLPTLATKADMGEVRADLHKVDASIKTWMLGTVVTIIGTMLAAIFGISQVSRANQATPPSNQQPIIINVPSQQPALAPTK